MQRLTLNVIIVGFSSFFMGNPALALDPHPTSEGRCGALVRGFWTEVFGERNVEASPKYITEDYIQHSPPPIPNGKEWMAYWKGVYAKPSYGPGKDSDESQIDFKTEITKIVGDDQFAILVAHDSGTYDHGPKRGQSYDSRYSDIFRCAGNKIVEHWYSPD